MKIIYLLALLIFPSLGFCEIDIALTVDDLPSHAELPPHTTRIDVVKKMLSVLKRKKIPEVYGFVNAKKLENFPSDIEVLKLWRGAGYPLGNHSYSHKDLALTKIQEFEDDIKQNEPILEKLSGKTFWKFFRYPFLREGDTLEKRNAIRNYLFQNGYQIAQVTIDFEDWSWNTPYARCKR